MEPERGAKLLRIQQCCQPQDSPIWCPLCRATLIGPASYGNLIGVYAPTDAVRCWFSLV
jgi:hypothetical protein